MSDLLLYHASPSRSSAVLWMLEEIGQPYDIHLLSLDAKENRQPDYLAVNPMGKVPALKHKGAVITEAAAICTYLADEFPQAGLNVPIGDARRGPYLKWLFFAPSCIEPAVLDRFLKHEGGPQRMIGWGDFDSVLGTMQKGLATGPYLLGDKFTAADVVMGSAVRFGMVFKMLPELPEFKAYSARLGARPAMQRAQAKEAEFAAKRKSA